jgi:hypothetical protein
MLYDPRSIMHRNGAAVVQAVGRKPAKGGDQSQG